MEPSDTAAAINSLASAADHLAGAVMVFSSAEESAHDPVDMSVLVSLLQAGGFERGRPPSGSDTSVLPPTVVRHNPDLDAVFDEPAPRSRPEVSTRQQSGGVRNSIFGGNKNATKKPTPKLNSSDLFDAILRQKGAVTPKSAVPKAAAAEGAGAEAGMAEGALAGAEEGAVLGPEGALAGAAIGAVTAGGGKGGKGGGIWKSLGGLFGGGKGGGDETPAQLMEAGLAVRIVSPLPLPVTVVEGGGGQEDETPQKKKGFFDDPFGTSNDRRKLAHRALPQTSSMFEAGADIFSSKNPVDAANNLIKFRDAVAKSTDALLANAREFEDFSASMGLVLGQREMQESLRKMEVGNRLAGSTKFLTEGEQYRKNQEKEIGVLFDRVENIALGLGNRLVGLVEEPLSQLAKSANGLLDSAEKILAKFGIKIEGEDKGMPLGLGGWADKQAQAGQKVLDDANARMARVRAMGGR